MLLAGWSCFCFKAVNLTISLATNWSCFCFKAVSWIVGLAIDDVELIVSDVINSLLK